MNTVKITKDRLIVLLSAEAELSMLKAGGVDNWDGASDALFPDEGETLKDYTNEIRKSVYAMDESTIVEE